MGEMNEFRSYSLLCVDVFYLLHRFHWMRVLALRNVQALRRNGLPFTRLPSPLPILSCILALEPVISEMNDLLSKSTYLISMTRRSSVAPISRLRTLGSRSRLPAISGTMSAGLTPISRLGALGGTSVALMIFSRTLPAGLTTLINPGQALL